MTSCGPFRKQAVERWVRHDDTRLVHAEELFGKVKLQHLDKRHLAGFLLRPETAPTPKVAEMLKSAAMCGFVEEHLGAGGRLDAQILPEGARVARRGGFVTWENMQATVSRAWDSITALGVCGQYVYCGYGDGRVTAMDAGGNQVWNTQVAVRAISGFVECQDMLVVGAKAARINLTVMDPKRGTREADLEGHTHSISAVAAYGEFLVSLSCDENALKVWDASSGRHSPRYPTAYSKDTPKLSLSARLCKCLNTTI